MHTKRGRSLVQTSNPSKEWAAAALGLFLIGAIVSSSCARHDRTADPKDAHRYEVIIVGAGAGGLGAAATLAKAGVKTLVLEQHDKPGGYMIAVAEKIIPGLGTAIEVEAVGSPHTMERYTLNYKGAFMGWAPTPSQSGLNRMKPRTPIDRLWLAGAWTVPGGGQSACLYSGYSTAREILKRIR